MLRKKTQMSQNLKIVELKMSQKIIYQRRIIQYFTFCFLLDHVLFALKNPAKREIIWCFGSEMLHEIAIAV